MTSYIAQVATGDIPPGLAVDAAFAVGLLLFVLTFIVNMLAMRVVERIKTGKRTSKGFFGKVGGIFSAIWLKIIEIPGRLRKTKKELTLKIRYRRSKVGVSVMAMCLLAASLFLIYLQKSN